MRLKTLPASQLDRLIRENQAVYIINTSSLPSGDKGMVIVNFFDGNRREFFKMPPTFIPMAITDSVPSRQLGDSKDFRQCLLKGMLTLVEPQSAELFLASEEAQDEYEALVLAEHSAAAQGININKPVSQRARVAHYSGEGGAGPMQDISAIDTVSNKVRGLVESLIANTLNPKEVLVQLRRHQSALQSVDFSYILANTTNPDLKQWAKACLSKSAKDDYEEEVEEPVVEVKAKRKKNEPKEEPKVAAKESKKKETYTDVFDFKEDKNVNEDFRTQQAVANQQSIYGESKVEQEINDMISGKKSWV